jgi:hypothetical protein
LWHDVRAVQGIISRNDKVQRKKDYFFSDSSLEAGKAFPEAPQQDTLITD